MLKNWVVEVNDKIVQYSFLNNEKNMIMGFSFMILDLAKISWVWQQQQQKIDKLDYIKMENFCAL